MPVALAAPVDDRRRAAEATPGEPLLDLSPWVTLRGVVGRLETPVLSKPAVDARPVHSRGRSGRRAATSPTLRKTGRKAAAE